LAGTGFDPPPKFLAPSSAAFRLYGWNVAKLYDEIQMLLRTVVPSLDKGARRLLKILNL
jgi:hypothetical protein